MAHFESIADLCCVERAAHAGFCGILQADTYTGFTSLCEPDMNGPPRIREAACWAHLRRDLFDFHKETGSAFAQEA